MTDLACQTTYGWEYGARMAAASAIIALCTTGSNAQTGTWEEFETLCLTPLEEVTLAQPEDLNAHKNFKNDGDTYSTYKIASAKIAISDGRAAQAQWCYISTRPPVSVPFGKQAESWREVAIASGRYELIDEYVLGFHLRSTEWREPRIDVTLRMQGKGAYFVMRAEETDLEG